MHAFRPGDVIHDTTCNQYELIVAVRPFLNTYRYKTMIIENCEAYKDGQYVAWMEETIMEYYNKISNVFDNDIKYHIIEKNGWWYVYENFTLLEEFDDKQKAERYLAGYKRVMR